MTSHSPIGASGYSRWSVCSGSVRLSQDMESQESEYAAEGTRAHALAETCLRDDTDAWEHAFTTDDPEMVENVQVFLDAVRADTAKYRAEGLAPTILIEQEFSLAPLGHPDAFGTADAVVIFPAWGLLRVYDFKYGAGIVVEAENNGQLRYYAVGVLHSLLPARAGMIKQVEVTIVQPRAEHRDGPVRREKLTVEQLNKWVETDLLPAIVRTRDPNAPLVEGPHCRFCEAKTLCPVLDTLQTQLAQLGARDPVKEAGKLEDWELSERLARIAPVEMYVKALKDEAFVRLQRGTVLPGWKLVPKKANRVLKDGGAEAAVKKWGDDALTEPELKSPAQLEKLPGGKEWTAAWAFKPDAGLSLAPDTDKRESVRVRTPKEIFAAAIAKSTGGK